MKLVSSDRSVCVRRGSLGIATLSFLQACRSTASVVVAPTAETALLDCTLGAHDVRELRKWNSSKQVFYLIEDIVSSCDLPRDFGSNALTQLHQARAYPGGPAELLVSGSCAWLRLCKSSSDWSWSFRPPHRGLNKGGD